MNYPDPFRHELTDIWESLLLAAFLILSVWVLYIGAMALCALLGRG